MRDLEHAHDSLAGLGSESSTEPQNRAGEPNYFGGVSNGRRGNGRLPDRALNIGCKEQELDVVSLVRSSLGPPKHHAFRPSAEG